MKSCNRKVLELFYNAKHAGRIMKPDAIGRIGEDSDGMVIELTWRIVDDIIVEAKFRAFGNPNAIAITSLMTDSIIGKSVEDAMLINEDVIVESLDELRPEYIEAYDMVHMAMAEAYNNYLKHQNRKDSVAKVEYLSEYQTELEQDDFNLKSEIENEIQAENYISAEKRGRGRPRKERTAEELLALELASTEKRGRGRPRKERTPEELEALELASTEKRGRGRPRKIVDESQVAEVGEKRGRGRPRKEVKIELPKSDLDEVINDEEVDQLINGNTIKPQVTDNFVNDLISNKLIDEDDETFDADYDLFKSNIRNIFSGREVNHSSYGTSNKKATTTNKTEETIDKIDSNILEESGNTFEQSANGNNEQERPKKIEIEEVQSTEPVRPRVDMVNSITRSLTTSGGVPSYNNTQDIVFASKNVTTTNININVTKTTTTSDDRQSVSDDYSKNINISSVKENSMVSLPASEVEQDEEIEIDPVEFKDALTNEKYDADDDVYDDEFDDDVEDEVDASHIKDEAPKGGIEDLLKALLED
ncbi:MAG: iron-sulfur cluster assembly scaffold protein [Clostridia bacterium]|nr:iron-sulfur cluster assembly scaffold protein [Clostridia bacterium]